MEPVTEEEARELRDVLEKFYGPVVRTWTINYGMYEVLGRLITESQQCTRAMHLVPRPWDLAAPAKWAQRQMRQAIVRHFKTPEGQHYLTCMKFAANNYRREFDMATHGL